MFMLGAMFYDTRNDPDDIRLISEELAQYAISLVPSQGDNPMSERPILFSAPMVKKLLGGAKSQTRRAIKPQPIEGESLEVGPYAPTVIDRDGMEGPGIEGWGASSEYECIRCPYGKPGDRLWVREGTIVHGSIPQQLIGYAADGCRRTETWEKAMSPIHMRRAHCRIVLAIAEVRVQRIQDITEEDAIAEGFDTTIKPYTARGWYRGVWDSINGAGAWERNDWCWAISFTRVQP